MHYRCLFKHLIRVENFMSAFIFDAKKYCKNIHIWRYKPLMYTRKFKGAQSREMFKI